MAAILHANTMYLVIVTMAKVNNVPSPIMTFKFYYDTSKVDMLF